jgi:hypothetical protein
MSWVQKVDSQLVLMIEASHPLHTHNRSSLYICNAIQHLLLWLQVLKVITGCTPCLIFTLCDLRVDVVGAEGGLSVGTYD